MRKFDIDIIKALKCPYCGRKPVYVDSKEVYLRSYGMIYLCRPCHAWVGVHKNTNKPLGRLANKELRYWKKRAHFFFDQLWQKAIAQGRTKRQARLDAYTWLSEELRIDFDHCHIGMFSILDCKKVEVVCKPYCKEKEYKYNH